MELTKLNIKQIQERIHKLEYKRDFIGCHQSDIDQLNATRIELIKLDGVHP